MNPEGKNDLTSEELSIIDGVFKEIYTELLLELNRVDRIEAKKMVFSKKIGNLFAEKIRLKIRNRVRAELIISTYPYLNEIMENMNMLRSQANPKYIPPSADTTRRMFKDAEEPTGQGIHDARPRTVIDPVEPVVHEDLNPPQRPNEVQPDLF